LGCLNAGSVERSGKDELQNLLLSTQRLQAQQLPLQQHVNDMVESATHLLRLSGPASGQAEKMFNQILSVTSDFEAAFTAALSVLDESLALAISMDGRIDDLEKEQARLKALAVFRDPIETFRESVAEEAGRASWQKLAKELYLERFRERKIVRAEIADALDRMGMNVSVWDDVRLVADAAIKEFHHGKNMHPRLLKSMVSRGALPKDLWSCNASMTSMLDWLSSVI